MDNLPPPTLPRRIKWGNIAWFGLILLATVRHGVVQAIDAGRTPEWTDFYRQLMAFRPLPEGHWFGAVHKGTLLESPCRSFYIQLVEPPDEA